MRDDLAKVLRDAGNAFVETFNEATKHLTFSPNPEADEHRVLFVLDVPCTLVPRGSLERVAPHLDQDEWGGFLDGLSITVTRRENPARPRLRWEIALTMKGGLLKKARGETFLGAHASLRGQMGLAT